MTLAASRTDLVEDRVRALFTPAAPPRTGPGRVGVEIELLPVRRGEDGGLRPAPLSLVRRCLAHDPSLERDGRISFEPGGQLELSPGPFDSVSACLAAASALLSRVRRCGQREGVMFVAAALSPWHDAEEIGLQTDRPRYCAMQDHFDRIGPWGRRMMRQTAALQVCVDSATPSRWRMLNAVAPALTAAFAASPVLARCDTQQQSARTDVWMRVDPSRTGFDALHCGPDVVGAYTQFALDAWALPVPRSDVVGGAVPGVSMREWLDGASGRCVDDVDHHLTTLFPPVRPRGHLELRCLDALPERWMAVPVVLLAALVADDRACSEARDAVAAGAQPGADSWGRAARDGVRDPALRATATALFDVALRAVQRLPRGYMPAAAATQLWEFRQRFCAAGRAPADELLAAFAAAPEDPAPWT